MEIEPIGVVRRVSDDECILQIEPVHQEGLDGLGVGDRVLVLYWMHELTAADRRTLKCHPRGDRNRPKRGVFALRSPMRPNPIGATVAEIVGLEGSRLTVTGLDALDGSLLIDIKIAT